MSEGREGSNSRVSVIGTEGGGAYVGVVMLWSLAKRWLVIGVSDGCCLM